jgi:hypothetical protein
LHYVDYLSFWALLLPFIQQCLLLVTMLVQRNRSAPILRRVVVAVATIVIELAIDHLSAGTWPNDGVVMSACDRWR